MSLDASLPIVLAQMGHVEKIAHNETTTPEAQRESAKHMAAEALKDEQRAIERTNEAESARVMLHKDGGGGRRQPRKRQAKPRQESAGDEQEPQSESPWQGNILDMKV